MLNTFGLQLFSFALINSAKKQLTVQFSLKNMCQSQYTTTQKQCSSMGMVSEDMDIVSEDMSSAAMVYHMDTAICHNSTITIIRLQHHC